MKHIDVYILNFLQKADDREKRQEAHRFHFDAMWATGVHQGKNKAVHLKHSSHQILYLLIYLIWFPPLEMIFVFCFFWMLSNTSYLMLSNTFSTSYLFVMDDYLNITTLQFVAYSWKQAAGVLISTKSKGMFRCHFIYPTGVKCYVKCISFSDLAKGKNKIKGGLVFISGSCFDVLLTECPYQSYLSALLVLMSRNETEHFPLLSSEVCQNRPKKSFSL